MNRIPRANPLVVACAVFLALLGAGGEPLLGQQSKETVDMKRHPLKLDNAWGVAAARIGEGRIHQMEVTIVEIPAGGKLAVRRHLAEEMVYIISGQGYTEIWNQANGKKERYGWKSIQENVEEFIAINSDNDPWGCDDIASSTEFCSRRKRGSRGSVRDST